MELCSGPGFFGFYLLGGEPRESLYLTDINENLVPIVRETIIQNDLHNVIFASPYKSRIKVLQSIGRGLRRTEQKNAVKLYDIADDISYKNKKNFTLLHFQDRINIYNEEQFDYVIDRVNI